MRIEKVGTMYPEKRQNKEILMKVLEDAGYIVTLDSDKYDAIIIFSKTR